MYWSWLLINVGNNPDRPRPGRSWLGNRYHVHQRLCMAFPSATRKARDEDFLQPFRASEFGNGQVHVKRATDSGFLFRIDPLPNGRAMIMVQSATEPDWGYAFRNACHLLAAPPQVQSFDLQFWKGQLLRFSLAANPTRRLSKHSPDVGEGSIGKRVPVQTGQLVDWLARRADSGGFTIEQQTIATQLGYVFMSKGGKGQRLFSVLFDGVLRVADGDAFRETVISGIGSGKAFGFGLLLIARANTRGAESGV